jgi:hypothetical protein
LCVLVAVCLPALGIEGFTIRSVIIRVYRDGLVHVNQSLSVN